MIRKKRTDRNHVVYCITCLETGKQYVGLTVLQGTVNKALALRLNHHFRRARRTDKSWELCKHLRKHESIVIDPTPAPRGKKAAHELEVFMIGLLKPVLNTHRARMGIDI